MIQNQLSLVKTNIHLLIREIRNISQNREPLVGVEYWPTGLRSDERPDEDYLNARVRHLQSGYGYEIEWSNRRNDYQNVNLTANCRACRFEIWEPEPPASFVPIRWCRFDEGLDWERELKRGWKRMNARIKLGRLIKTPENASGMVNRVIEEFKPEGVLFA